MYQELDEWIKKLLAYKIPRWEELPNFELYSDQVLQLINDFVKDVIEDKNVITASMINNYVKLKLIPKPQKKKYTKVHLAYLLAITMLKQILTIEEISSGITYQAEKSGGLKQAYNIFAEEMEKSIHHIGYQMANENVELEIYDTKENQAMHFAADAFAGKIVAKKILNESILKRGANNE